MKKIINWDEIDPWLREITTKGSLVVIAKKFNVSKWSLHFRRKALNLPPLPKGRPIAKDFTERELAVKQLLDEGHMQTKIAKKLSTTVASVENAVSKIRHKEKIQALYCHTCNGLGLVTCNHCRTPTKGASPHFHVCPDCQGNSIAR